MRELAQKMGVHPSLIGQIEGGQNTTTKTLEAFVTACGATLTVSFDAPRRAPAAPVDRLGLVGRFVAVLPSIPDDQLDSFVSELALWEKAESRRRSE